MTEKRAICVVGYGWCGYTLRCMVHLETMGAKFYFVNLETPEFQQSEQYQPDKKLPQVYIHDEYIGGFEELRKRFPL